ncbi:5-formyltetrahydrofolate cyclo-ligase [Paenibacillus sp. 1001270B_150601_E10]|uniref:5-formyltetrahydrofolate cyclo-ligase n=1 Tax=Paenibacillus sp. 1001270B_150601_E10 TaxID=2787079 RepID=UPI00189D030A|nr:5-formyltetrahydrofolate cyclo-ligase [Paenibacillus sp. 1001270B_150601_E10]
MNKEQLTHHTSVKVKKQELRSQLKRARQDIEPSKRLQASEAACARASQLLEVLRQDTAKRLTLCAYMPYGPELDIIPLMEACLSRGDLIYIPRTMRENHTLQWMEWNADTPLETGVFGIREPSQEAKALSMETMKTIDAVLVPGLGFDRSGGRLGMGAGYYDRFLSMWQNAEDGEKPCLISVCFEEQLVEQVPVEPHDEVIDVLITPEQVIWTDKR